MVHSALVPISRTVCTYPMKCDSDLIYDVSRSLGNLGKVCCPWHFPQLSRVMRSAKIHPHTREAVLKRIMIWVDDPANEPHIMWMFGSAGAGKTAIAQSITEISGFQQRKLTASFFFLWNASGYDNETQFISTLVYQLVLTIPEIQDSVNKALEENGSQNSWPRLINVNGLNECGQAKNQRYILDVLSTVTRELTYPLLFFIASCPEQVICDSFSKESMCSVTTCLTLDHNLQIRCRHSKISLIEIP